MPASPSPPSPAPATNGPAATNYDDSTWESVNVPHDYLISLQGKRKMAPRKSLLLSRCRLMQRYLRIKC